MRKERVIYQASQRLYVDRSYDRHQFQWEDGKLSQMCSKGEMMGWALQRGTFKFWVQFEIVNLIDCFFIRVRQISWEARVFGALFGVNNCVPSFQWTSPFSRTSTIPFLIIYDAHSLYFISVVYSYSSISLFRSNSLFSFELIYTIEQHTITTTHTLIRLSFWRAAPHSMRAALLCIVFAYNAQSHGAASRAKIQWRRCRATEITILVHMKLFDSSSARCDYSIASISHTSTSTCWNKQKIATQL